MTRVVSSLVTDDDLRLLRQMIDDCPLAVVTPLGAQDDN